MLDINYSYEYSIGEKQVKKFFPLINTIDANAVLLQAPNSTGKTFIINILGMGLFAREIHDTNKKSSLSNIVDNGCVSPILVNSINEIVKLPSDKLEFDFSLTSKDGNTRLHAIKKVNDKFPTLYESIDGGKEQLLLQRAFSEKYYLIYDFPKSPIERIPDMIKSIKIEQKKYSDKINNLLKAVKDHFNEITIAKGRDDDLREYKKELSDLTDKKDELVSELDELKEKYKIFEEYYLLSRISSLLRESNKYTSEAEAKKKEKVISKRNATQSSNKYLSLKASIDDKLESISNKIAEFISLLKATDFYYNGKLLKAIKFIESYDFLKCSKTYDYDRDSNRLKTSLNLIRMEAASWKPSPDMKEASSKREIYGKLINVLEDLKRTQHDFNDITIPGTDNKSIEEFIRILRESFNEANDLGSKYSNSEKVMGEIKELTKLIDDSSIQRNLQELKKLKLEAEKTAAERDAVENEESYDVDDDLDEKISKILNELGFCADNLNKKYGYTNQRDLGDTTKVSQFIDKFLNNHKEYMSYLNPSDKLKENMRGAESRISFIENKEIPRIEERMQRISDDISKISNKSIPEYYNDYELISKILRNVLSLQSKFVDFSSYIDTIGDDKIDNKEQKLGPEGIRYNDILSSYFGDSIDNIVFQKKYVNPVKINLLSKIITTDSGLEIPIQRLSTGESMSMYVQSLLNKSSDSRKLIALFDESGTMDSTSFEPIKNIIKPLVDSGKLLFALFVSKNDTKLDIIKIA